MLSTDAVAVALATENMVIDKMELDTTKVETVDRTWLAEYQTKLASGTTEAEDLIFLQIFRRFIIKDKGKLE